MLDGRRMRIVRRAGDDRRPIVRLEGCERRDALAELQGVELLVAREEAPVLEPGEWWAEDLECCEVHDGERHVGTVRRLRALPSVEVLEVQRDDLAGQELLVPLVSDAVRAVDTERRRIDIDLRFLGEL
jgi:16S rRNA processing protein RimM